MLICCLYIFLTIKELKPALIFSINLLYRQSSGLCTLAPLMSAQFKMFNFSLFKNKIYIYPSEKNNNNCQVKCKNFISSLIFFIIYTKKKIYK